MPALSSSTAPLIKGYLPVRLRLPRQPQLVRREGDDDTEDTFFFVREHQGKSADDTNETTTTTKRGTTLFVANAPVVPGVSTKILLKSIFGRFADVARVTAVQNPRAAASAAAAAEDGITETETTTSSSPSPLAWSNNAAMFQPTFLPPIFSSSEGKYAHVVFTSAKEMKKAKKELEDLMTTTSANNNASSNSGKRRRSKGHNNKKGSEEEQEQQALILDKLEMQALSDESQRQREEAARNVLEEDGYGDSDDEDGDSDNPNNNDTNNSKASRKYAGVLAVAERYRESCKLIRTRSKLMEECNAVMQAYEDAEEAKRRAQEAAKAVPDDDGFVTVSYSSAVGSKIDFERSETATTPSRRKGNKRNRKKKEAIGAGELGDFYRFQRSDNRKRTMMDLRRQFEEDVRKVKRLKEEKEYRPF